ncbi:response regulator [Maribellus sp. CM-23]|uniref:hybrid sensor histidine kinase/response regulator n=1 Tax=Maribellus sp. CM-23 TaxID=2781026 RepID=UPI001F44C29E|nr:ATP-binding protein [Maribellus sp. CM-23]MCE4566122.1 response regulator [Maribellus sp. CM-23]
MRKTKIEIPIILITVVMLALIVLSGNMVYKSLSEIVESWLSEARPDYKLIMVKDLHANLGDVENSVKLYSLSKNKTYLETYSELNQTIDNKLNELQHYAISDTAARGSVDSLLVLSRQKLLIWKNILNLHLSKEDEHETFTQYFDKLDTMEVVKDTIHFQEAEKVGFFKRLLGKKPEPPQPIIVDRTVEQQSMRDEIAELEKEIAARNKALMVRETALMQKNLEINNALAGVISKLERQEQQSLLQKTQQADLLASQTYKRLTLFALTVLLLMFLTLVLFFRDLRKSRSYQKALQEAKNHAEQLARTKELFVATVSHEMRTPINAIYGLSEQLLLRKPDDKNRKDLEVIHKSTRHLIDLVNDTFDFTRIENQRIQLQPVDFYLDDLLEKIELFNREAATAKDIQLSLDKGNTADLVIYNDETRLKQILSNLVTNAIKFTDEGSVALKASLASEGNREWLRFEVTDTGIGISEENREKIFDDFVQLDTDANKKAGGTGLGLYIVKKLVALLDGTISLKSQPGVGTTFTVTIPYRKGNPDNIVQTSESLPAPKQLKGGKVLIVDDEEFNRHLLKNILGKWEIEFDEAENGQQAVEMAVKTSYHLIMMDIRMPVLNGIEASGLLKEKGVATKIIALSANKSQPGLVQIFDAFLEKPFKEADLYAVITQTLESSTAIHPRNNEEHQQFQPDIEELMNMANGDKVFLKEMIRIFISSSQSNLKKIKAGIDQQQWKTVADLAHKMAAPVKHMNIMPVYNTVKTLQQLAESSAETSQLEAQFARLRSEINILNTHLQNLLENNFTD